VQVLDVIAALLVLAGLFGVVLPVLPGTPLIFLGAVVYDIGRGWTIFGWGWLGLLLFLTLLSLVADWWLSTVGARQQGASWRALLAGIVLGIVGLFLLPPFGFVIGSIVGVVGVELLDAGDTRRALRAGRGWIVGWILSLVMEGSIAIMMMAIILWRAW
jgi:uncharacterized protein